ncbi:MAG: hypothetical protein ACE5JZ_04100 [Kiloniellales bacterium]
MPVATAGDTTHRRRRYRRPAGANAGRRLRAAPEWPADRLRRLIDGYAAGVGVDDIAAALGISRARVLHKARALGLIHRSRRRRPTAVPVAAAGSALIGAPAERPPLDDRNPLGPVARALRELAERVRETRNGFVLDRCPASAFRLIEAANAQLAAQGMAPIRVRAAPRLVSVRALAAES